RKDDLFSKCRKMCRDEKMFMPDQSALNKLAIKKKVKRRFNEQGRIRKNTVFKHFTTFFRFFPWFKAITIKPWDIDKVHNKLKIHQFDDVLEEYINNKTKIEGE
ncbi:MAG: glycosyltransferase family 8 protein, partial [Bacilli bacterium]|nr:glycosyltransferase family 8 protein [Bacilli bacterium]